MLKIKEIRQKKNITQDELVSLTGISKRSFVNYENGLTDIPFSKLQNIAIALNVSISELAGEPKSEENYMEENYTKPNVKKCYTMNQWKKKNMHYIERRSIAM